MSFSFNTKYLTYSGAVWIGKVVKLKAGIMVVSYLIMEIAKDKPLTFTSNKK